MIFGKEVEEVKNDVESSTKQLEIKWSGCLIDEVKVKQIKYFLEYRE